MITLSNAASLAHRRLASRTGAQVADGLLDGVAIALATWMPIYTGEPRRRLTDEEIGSGRLRRGARLLQFKDGRAPIEDLRVEPADLEGAIRQLELAGVTFAQAWTEDAPRRVPRVMPA